MIYIFICIFYKDKYQHIFMTSISDTASYIRILRNKLILGSFIGLLGLLSIFEFISVQNDFESSINSRDNAFRDAKIGAISSCIFLSLTLCMFLSDLPDSDISLLQRFLITIAYLIQFINIILLVIACIYAFSSTSSNNNILISSFFSAIIPMASSIAFFIAYIFKNNQNEINSI